MSKYIYTLGTLALMGIFNAANAQKIPEVQEISKLAPANIRADGKNLEWNNTFEANNKRTQLLYTVANDANNLYVAISCSDVATNNKIMAGGISFAVNTEGKKKDKEVPVLTYPLIKRTGDMRAMARMAGFGRRTPGQAEVTVAQRDSIMAVARKAQLALVKEIKIGSFKGVTDSLISIYNEYGIKAFASIDNKGVFFYEIAIPLKYLGVSPGAVIAYNVKLNGLQIPGLEGGFGGGNRPGGGGGSFGGGRPGGGGNFDMESLMSPTDFWGKYTLAK